MKYLFVIILPLVLIVQIIEAQESTNYSFQITNEDFSDFPNINIGFTFYQHTELPNFQEHFNTSNIILKENNTLLDSILLSQNSTIQKTKIIYLFDKFSKKDSSAVVKDINHFLQFPDSLTSNYKQLALIQKNNKIDTIGLDNLSILTKKDTFSLSCNNTELNPYITNNKLSNSSFIYIWVTNGITTNKWNEFVPFLKSFNKAEPPLVAIVNINETIPDIGLLKSQFGKLPFVIKNFSLKDKNKDFNITPLIKQWQQREFLLSFKTLNEFNLKTYHTYNLGSTNSGFDTISFHLNFPRKIVEEYFIKHRTTEISQLINSAQYQAAMNLINETNNLLKIIELDSLAWSCIEKYGIALAENKTEDALGNYSNFKSQWEGAPPSNYQQKELKLYKAYYKNCKIQNASFKNKIELATLIHSIEPNTENEYNLTIDKAYQQQTLNKNWDAIDLFFKAYAMQEQKDLKEHIESYLLKTYKKEHKTKAYSVIATRGNELQKWFKQPFLQNYILAEAYLDTNDFIKAQEQYEWLIDNWQKQNYLGWNQAFEKLQGILCMNYQFDAAIELNQQLYRKESKNEAIELSLFYSRARLCKPVIDIFPDLIKNVGTFSYIKDNIKLNTIDIPDWIAGITLTNEKLQTLSMLYQSNDYRIKVGVDLNQYNNFPVIELDITNNNYWLINKVNSTQFVVIQIANHQRTEQEKTLLDEIVKVKMDEQRWTNLFALEEKTGVKLCSQLLTGLWETELNKTNRLALDSYWSKLKDNSFLQFITFHKADGNKLNAGKPLPLSQYSEGDYQRSAKTVAYFEQKVNINSNTYFDTCNPMFNGKTWNGVIRIGFETYYE